MILKQTEVLLFHGGLNSGVQFVTGDGHTRDCVSLSMPKIKIRGSGFCIISSSFTWSKSSRIQWLHELNT